MEGRAFLTELDCCLRPKITFAELDTRGRRLECPSCHVQIIPHLGNWMRDNIQCNSCDANLCFRNTSACAARCPCCARPALRNNLTQLVCGGCEAKVIYLKTDRAVKCFDCKHVTIPLLVGNDEVRPVNQYPQAIQVVPPEELNRVVRTRVTLAVPTQFNGVIIPHVNRVVPIRVYRRRNRVATAETESTASSSTQQPEIIDNEYPDDSVAESVRNVATKGEEEQYKAEKAAGKRIRRD